MTKSWDSFMSRVIDAAKRKLRGNDDGLCIVTVHILCDAEGEPLVWTEPSVMRIEPSRDAKAHLLEIMSG